MSVQTKTSENKTTAQPAAAPKANTAPASAYIIHAPIQMKLTVGAADDVYEREANTMADRVLNMPAPQIPNSTAAVAVTSLQRNIQKEKGDEKEELKKKKVQAKFISRKESESQAGEAGVSSSFESRLQSSTSGGGPLPDTSRQFMESRFGADFSNVRVHTDSNAIQMSSQLNAQAFTYGNHIYFNESKFSPGTAGGDHLLAHELTHTIQQGAVVRKKVEVSTTPAPRIQRSIIDWVRERIAPIADNIPGYTLICFIIGRNPITGREVVRNAVNFIRALLGLIREVLRSLTPCNEVVLSKLRTIGLWPSLQN